MPLGQGGMGAAVVGTLEITGFAALMAVPLGILGAVYIGEYGGTELARQAGLVHGRRDGRRAVDRDGPVHLHDLGDSARALGYSGLAGSFALACLMLPLIIRSTYEMLRLVPNTCGRPATPSAPPSRGSR